jgi:hypothetical protein
VDVVAQTGLWVPGTANVTGVNKFSVEDEKRYWLHPASAKASAYARGYSEGFREQAAGQVGHGMHRARPRS